MVKLKEHEVKELVESCTTGIDYLLNRLKTYDVLTEKDYQVLGKLDDLIIEFDDVNTNYLYLQRINSKLRLNKKEGI